MGANLVFLGPVFFWIFVGAVVLSGVWRDIALRRETEETLRMAIDKGQHLDPALIEQIRYVKARERAVHSPYVLLVGGLVLIGTGFGLGLLGYFLKLGGAGGAFYPLVGVGSMLSVVGVMLIVGWQIVEKRHVPIEPPGPTRT